MRDGYHEVPAGKLANVVTYLEMRAPGSHPGSETSPFSIRQVQEPSLDWYRRMFRAIGEPWLWFSRLRMSDEELRAVLWEQAVDVFALASEGVDQGLLEFDRRKFPDIEVAFFGVTTELIGKGAGRALLAHGLQLEWQHRPERIWLHTCTSDHPAALSFYRKFGFNPTSARLRLPTTHV